MRGVETGLCEFSSRPSFEFISQQPAPRLRINRSWRIKKKKKKSSDAASCSVQHGSAVKRRQSSLSSEAQLLTPDLGSNRIGVGFRYISAFDLPGAVEQMK